MNRVKLTLAYDGTHFHGWQLQANAVTVQEVLQNALKVLFDTDITVYGCSRTDAGVHAKNFVCHFDMPRLFPLDKLPLALNAHLPDSIGILSAETVDDTFHARFSCKGKTYRYLIHNARLRDPFLEKRAYFYPIPLNAERMNMLAQSYIGEKDFAAFMAAGSSVQDTVRKMQSCSVIRNGDLIEFSVTGNGFLYNMVRIMVGTLILSDQGKLERSISEILSSKDRTLAGVTVPPQGLYLEKVYY